MFIYALIKGVKVNMDTGATVTLLSAVSMKAVGDHCAVQIQEPGMKIFTADESTKSTTMTNIEKVILCVKDECEVFFGDLNLIFTGINLVYWFVLFIEKGKGGGGYRK